MSSTAGCALASSLTWWAQAPLKAHLDATDGNLSVHLRKLEEAGYVGVSKSFRGRKPLTEVSLTESGRQAFMNYLEAMSALVGRK